MRQNGSAIQYGERLPKHTYVGPDYQDQAFREKHNGARARLISKRSLVFEHEKPIIMNTSIKKLKLFQLKKMKN